MTLRELTDMCNKYGISPDAELWLKPLLKDKERKATQITTDNGKIIIMATRTRHTAKPRR